MKIVIITIILLVVAISIYYVKFYKKKPQIAASFKDSVDLLKVPVITFTNNNQQFYFLIDSGASHSIININSIAKFKYQEVNGNSRIYGVEGNRLTATRVVVELKKKNYLFINEFNVLHVGGLDNIKAKYGVEIAGLIGSDFLKKYEFLVDFKKLRYYIFKDETNLKRGFFKNIKTKWLQICKM